MREEGVRSGQVLPIDHTLFVNTHPAEIEDLELMIFLAWRTAKLEPRRPIVLEIHEAAVTCGEQMRTLRAALTEMQIGLAYDDFGAGQARLVELVDVPPDYLKFDMRLVQNLESASIERQRMLASLVQMVRDLGITPLAEGIERPKATTKSAGRWASIRAGIPVRLPDAAKAWRRSLRPRRTTLAKNQTSSRSISDSRLPSGYRVRNADLYAKVRLTVGTYFVFRERQECLAVD